MCALHDTKKAPGLTGRIALDTRAGEFLNEERVTLLETIERLGSLSAAARALPVSYKTAWDSVCKMNALAGQKLVVANAGGSRGGGSRLTEYGRRLISMYRVVEVECQTAIGLLQRYIDDGTGPLCFRRALGRQPLNADKADGTPR